VRGTIRRMVTHGHRRPPPKVRSLAGSNGRPDGRGVVLLVVVDGLMMAFSVVSGLLAQQALAAITGAACVSLTRKIARHLLS
jgi:hypothetical protein